MKKITLLVTSISILSLTSCSKEDTYDCEQIRKDFQAEIEIARKQSQSHMALRYVNEKYAKYPCW
jgi:hypothetical protein